MKNPMRELKYLNLALAAIDPSISSEYLKLALDGAISSSSMIINNITLVDGDHGPDIEIELSNVTDYGMLNFMTEEMDLHADINYGDIWNEEEDGLDRIFTAIKLKDKPVIVLEKTVLTDNARSHLHIWFFSDELAASNELKEIERQHKVYRLNEKFAEYKELFAEAKKTLSVDELAEIFKEHVSSDVFTEAVKKLDDDRIDALPKGIQEDDSSSMTI